MLDGGAGEDDGGTEDDLSGLSPATQRYVREQEKELRGEPADRNGDGRPDTFTERLPNGIMRVWTDENLNGQPESFSETAPNGDYREEYDLNEDGNLELVHTVTVGPPRVEVTTQDTNENGKLDTRDTSVFSTDEETVRIIKETDADEDGNFTVVSEEVVPNGAELGTAPPSCDPAAGFPTDVSGKRMKVGNIIIPYGGGGGRCSEDEAIKLKAAADCATESLDCLMRTNKLLKKRVDEALKRTKITMGCGGTCKPTGFFKSKGDNATVNWNSSKIKDLQQTDMCSAVLHETLHTAFESLGKSHDDGIDQLYSCGRYCGRCSGYGPVQPPPSKNVDCARCAGTSAEKRACGTQEKLVAMTCPKANLLCHGTLGTNANCKECKGLEDRACDGSKLLGTTPNFRCCEKCPPGADRMNDKPCTGITGSPGTCGQKPPQCPGG
ncbi:hypothetical protein [Myxococcus sp. RHSTA-1-4]|uniref:hypothetical protein n=1 Tax=Myxococcus sp. RHSTA-1-4 TaxID=2874601 RepID=UPI001CBE8F05|nr:hypothetical protein [Myxococcus sp. RHSTA-1-4]